MKERKTAGNQRPPQAANPAKRPRDSLPWRSLEQQVVRAQKQIAQAAQRGDRQTVYDLQQRLLESEAARLLAVRRVTGENQGKDTAGVDGVKSLNHGERLAMASAIHPKNWNYQPPMPVRRVWVPKPGTTERRPLAILSMIDRCKQALVKLALEPEWEVRFEAHSYGFRPGRGAHDAIAAIVVAIERQPVYVFDADIEAAFDYINHAVLLAKLQTSPALRQVISGWLTAGVMDGASYSPGETGIAQGGVLSPLLMNVALHGMEAVVRDGADNGRGKVQPLLVRYADDFVILHSDLKELQQAVRRVKNWLARLGLHLRADKTHITHTLTPYQGQVGFDFLGFNIRQEWEGRARMKTIIAPSQEANRRHLAAIEQRLQKLQTAPQARVIEELNPLIVGWVAYYNGVVPAATMSRYDDLVEQRLMNWAGKRHPGKARDWLLNRYWQHVGKDGRVFATHDGARLRPYGQTSILGG
ncbi:MAG TPA: reverse transcriptase domain-containing protein [Ktedonobacteraceae bacterium]|nr:reverse transcriptase domain-containing protein [Ktedonobacteraceae bacterium]